VLHLSSASTSAGAPQLTDKLAGINWQAEAVQAGALAAHEQAENTDQEIAHEEEVGGGNALLAQKYFFSHSLAKGKLEKSNV